MSQISQVSQQRNFSTVAVLDSSAAKRSAMDESDDEKMELAQLKKDSGKKDAQVFHKKKMDFWAHMRVAWNLTKKAFYDIYIDARYLKKIFSGNAMFNKYYTAVELKERRRISKDLLKFVPIGVMFAIPGGEFAIPAYLVVIPNGLPTQFIFESEIGKKTAAQV